MPWQKQFDVDEVLDKAMQAFWVRIPVKADSDSGRSRTAFR